MTIFSIKKTYRTDLTGDEIKITISKRLAHEKGIFKVSLDVGTVTNDGFSFISQAKGRLFPVKVQAKLEQQNNGSTLIVQYKPTFRFWFGIIIVWVFFIFAWFADNFTLNGEEVSLFKKILAGLGFLLLLHFLFILSTISSLLTEKQKLQTDLKLK